MEKVTFTKEEVECLMNETEELIDMKGISQFYLEYFNTSDRNITEFHLCDFEGRSFMKAKGKTKYNKINNENILALDFDELNFNFIPRMSFSEKEIDNMGSGSLKDYSIDYDTDDGYFDAEKRSNDGFLSIFILQR